MPLSAIMQKRYPACNASINGNLWAVKCIPNYNINLCRKLQDYHRPVNPSLRKSRNQLIGTRCLLGKLGRFRVGEHTSYEALEGFCVVYPWHQWYKPHQPKPMLESFMISDKKWISCCSKKPFQAFFRLLTIGSIWYSNYPCLLTFMLFLTSCCSMRGIKHHVQPKRLPGMNHLEGMKLLTSPMGIHHHFTFRLKASTMHSL